MTSDDPFSEGDADKTVIRPNPGGRRSTAPAPHPAAAPAAQPAAAPDPFGMPEAAPAPQAPPQTAPPEAPTGAPAIGVPTGAAAPRASSAEGAEELVLTGMNRLNACAAPLFALISRSRNRAQHLDPDKLRQNADAIDFVRRFFVDGKPVAAICHGAQTLIECDVLHGRELTSYPAIKTDLKNAGARWVDREMVCDQGLVTSRTPDDLPAFIAKTLEEIAEGKHARQKTA